jgi:glycosyltransferase involved in cell wall biosynthesis
MAKRIKILFTIPNFDTAGSGKVVYDLVNGLDKTIFEPEICCFHDRGDFFKTIESLGVKIHLFQFAADYRPFLTLPLRIIKIARFFKTHQFDVIHSWHWSSDFTEPLAAKLAGIPFVYTKKAMGWGNRSWIWRSKLSTKVITINTDMVTQFFGSMIGKVEPIPLGVDLLHFNPNLKFNMCRADLDLKEDDFVIVSVANLVAVKGIEILLDAVIKLNDPTIKVLIVGDYNNDYGYHIKSTYERESFVFMGKKQDVRPYLSLADVFVIPTKNEGRKEGLPIAPIEAMAMGKTVIGSNISGVKDILSEFNDYLFEAGSIKDLSETIDRIRTLPSEVRKTQSEKIRQYVEETYDIFEVVFRHQQLYKKVVV